MSSEHDEAWESAGNWLQLHPDGSVLFGRVRMGAGSGAGIVAALNRPLGTRLVSERRAGQVTWREVSALELAAAS